MTSFANSPLVIGGLGGSGTRLVAELFKEMGYFFGADVNDSGDNLWFTMLLKRPAWFDLNLDIKADEITLGLNILTKVLCTGGKLTAEEMTFIDGAEKDLIRFGYDRGRPRSKTWSRDRTQSLLGGASITRDRWGWKEPNTHIYLEQLAQHFSNLRYVYVVRHGLDMAFSPNLHQLINWGPKLGVQSPGNVLETPQAALQFWIVATQRAIRLGEQLLGERFLFLKYDDLCIQPRASIDRMLEFLHIRVEDDVIRSMVALPRVPESIGRYRERNLSDFSIDQLENVRRFGFKVPPFQ